MEVINNENDYQEVMKRIDELIYETTEDTPIDDPRLQELDRLATLVESYEKQVYNFSCDSLCFVKLSWVNSVCAKNAHT